MIRIKIKETGLYAILFIALTACENKKQSPVPNEAIVEKRLWTEEEKKFILDGLERTRDELLSEINDLSEEQWRFVEDSGRWSISEIVEHLEVQEEMYYREIYVTSKAPQVSDFSETVRGNDEKIHAYANDPTAGDAGFMLTPIGRFGSKELAEKAFLRARNEMIKFVSETDLDLRRFFTFRKYPKDGLLSDPGLWDVRDLHQLLLTTIAHTDRHIGQLRRVKLHENYPK